MKHQNRFNVDVNDAEDLTEKILAVDCKKSSTSTSRIGGMMIFIELSKAESVDFYWCR